MKSLIQFIKEQEESEHQPGWVDIKDIKDSKTYRYYDFVDLEADPDDWYNDFVFDEYIVDIDHGYDSRLFNTASHVAMRFKTKKLNHDFIDEDCININVNSEQDVVKEFRDDRLANKKVERVRVTVDGENESFYAMQFIVKIDGYYDVVMTCRRSHGEGYWKKIRDDSNTIAMWDYDMGKEVIEDWLDDYFKDFDIRSITWKRRRRQENNAKYNTK